MKRWSTLVLAMGLAGCSQTGERGNATNPAAPDNGALPGATARTAEVEAPGAPQPPPAPEAPDGVRASQFLTLSADRCRLVEENAEEAGYWLRRCTGVGGYDLDWSESDLRQNLIILDGGAREKIALSRLVTNGAFNSIASTVEWRGERGDRPDRLIVRVNVADGADPTRPDISKLVVIRLDPKACIAGIVPPGPDQSDRARAIADRDSPACLSA